jgi:hypothetical protein
MYLSPGVSFQDASAQSWGRPLRKFLFLKVFQTATTTECEDAPERADPGMDKLPRVASAAWPRVEPSPCRDLFSHSGSWTSRRNNISRRHLEIRCDGSDDRESVCGNPQNVRLYPDLQAEPALEAPVIHTTIRPRIPLPVPECL